MQELTKNAYIYTNTLNGRLRTDDGGAKNQIVGDKNSPNGYFCYYGWDASSANRRRKLQYTIPGMNIEETFQTVCVSFWNTITGFLYDRNDNDPACIFMTRKNRNNQASTLSVGDDVGIKIELYWENVGPVNFGQTHNEVTVEISVKYRDRNGSLISSFHSFYLQERREEFQHTFIVIDGVIHTTFQNPASFVTEEARVCNISEGVLGCRFDKEHVCRFDFCYFAVYNTQITSEFAYKISAETYTNVDSLVVFNQAKFNALDVL